MKHRIRFIVGLCAIVTGCSASTSPRTPPTDHDLEGSWGEPFPPGGNTFIMALAESSGVVHGTGSFAGEAAPYGGLAVSGTIANRTAHLRVIFNFEPHLFPTLGPDTGQFVGQLITTDSIAGQLTVNGRTSIVPLVRLRINDPLSQRRTTQHGPNRLGAIISSNWHLTHDSESRSERRAESSRNQEDYLSGENQRRAE